MFISIASGQKEKMVEPARRLKQLGFDIVCTSGTARVLSEAGIDVEVVRKLQEGRPNLLDLMANGEIQFIFNTPSGKAAQEDDSYIRKTAIKFAIPYITTAAAAAAESA